MDDARLQRAVRNIVAPWLYEDVMQEVRIRVWQLSEERPGEDISGLAMMVARRHARRISMRALKGDNPWTGSPSNIGKTRGEVTIIHGDEPLDEDRVVWDEAQFSEDDDRLAWAEMMTVLDKLPAEDRDLTVMRYWYMMNDTEIGDELGISKNAVQKRWSRIKPKLREVLSV